VVQPTRERAQQFYHNLKQRALQYQRQPDQLRILPGMVPIVGNTQRDAEERAEYLKSLITVESGLSFVSASMNIDLSQYPIDGPVPDLREQITGSKGRFQYVIASAIEQNLTLGEMAKRYAESLSFPAPTGTADTIAKQMIEWYQHQACDGFVILPTYKGRSLSGTGGAAPAARRRIPERISTGHATRSFRFSKTGKSLSHLVIN